ncbi:Serine/threonine-protein_phosphatase 2C [Hexamita inflata]|uniref:Serine/threonine-protein phosphatase 2C n=1 Tax=Hexamita inflata TaxID=28002 RepID=A0AA86VAH4_9EUKA|nr:Serine/threonine-protein phosphatase 2C [Hexamita inflata]
MLRITSVYGIGHAEDQNSRFRKTMEDATVMIDKFGNNPDLGYFAVFDGHGGPEASKTAAESVHKILIDELVRQQMPNQEDSSISLSPTSPKLPASSKIDLDQNFDYTELFKRAILKADQYMKEKGHVFVGCTACICFVSKNFFTLINVGDSRAVLSTNGIAQRLTVDHKAADKNEQVRIKNAGGGIVMGRVNGFISVSRALGDWCIKTLVISEPDVFRIDRQQKDEFIILACDGIWDVLNDQQAVDVVKKCLKECGSPQRAASELKNAALRLGSQDNVSVLILVLKEPGQM